MNRFSNFVKSGGEAYIIGSSQADVKIPHKKRVSVKKNPGCGTSDGTFRNKRYFQCDPDSGVFVGLDALMPMDDAEYNSHSKTPKRDEDALASLEAILRDTVFPSFLKRKNDQSLQATTVDTLKIDQRVVTFLEYNGNPVRGTVCFNGEEKDASGRVLVGLELVGNSEIIVSYCLLEAQLVRDSSLILIVFRDGGVDLVAYEPIKHKHSTF
ncbi:uncharacterized protein [Montipora capricornis]|uniref:uncharacterized protein isoform X1 n=1 Tax=Montipora capricornis TaxID=246305 RepID=UPI0035F21085